MSAEADVGAQIVETILKFVIEGAEFSLKITGTLAKHSAALLLAALRKPKTRGRVRLMKMLTEGKPISIFTIKQTDLHNFYREARRYGVTYNVVKGKEICDVMVTSEQAPQVKKVLDNLKIGLVEDSEIEQPTPIDTKAKTEQKEKEQTFADQVVGVSPERAQESQKQAIDSIVQDEPTKENPQKTLTKSPPSKSLSEQKRQDKAEKPSIKKEIQTIKQTQAAKKTDINRALNRKKHSIKK